MTYQPDPLTPTGVTSKGAAGSGYLDLVQTVLARLRGLESSLVLLDTYWHPWLDQVLSHLRNHWSSSAQWFDTREALKSPETLQQDLAEYLTEDPVFGRVCDRDLDLFLEPSAWQTLCERVYRCLEQGGQAVVWGPGALLRPLRNRCHLAVYFQVPREPIFLASQQGRVKNLGDDRDRGVWPRYKRSFFVDWPVQDRHRNSVLDACELFCDVSDPDQPRFCEMPALDSALESVSREPFRVRSLFMPGVWGGQRLQQLIPGLPDDWPNCAWGFELVGPENSLKIALGDTELRLPFDLLMARRAKAVLGHEGYRRYGEFFPIRFDFLDTVGGTNLSCQVHPPEPYINAHFREAMAQHEMYYIMEAEPEAKVYLGLNKATTPEAFRQDVRAAEEDEVPFELSTHVNEWPAAPGDLFVIPAGTVHCSGAGNLVLEISATPYIYTFKIYDYLRPDLDGKPRPISSARAFEVLDVSRTTDWVQEQLLARPRLTEEGTGWRRYLLSDHPAMPHQVWRWEVQKSCRITTNGQVQVLCLVQGPKVTVRGAQREFDLHYGETVVVPAQCEAVTLQADGEVKVVQCHLRR